MKRWNALTALALAALGATGFVASSCGGDSAEASELVKSDVPRAAADSSAVPGAAAALDAFALDLFATLAAAEPGANLVFSPYSAVTALAMTRAGAGGETLEQMDAVLHADIAGDLDAGLNAIDQALAERPGEYAVGDETVELDLATANQLFAQDDYPFAAPFLDRLAVAYGAGVRLVDFRRATEDAREAINTWVGEQTRDRIPELIAEGVLTVDTRLVLTNAIYLKAPWRLPFGDATPGPFTLLDGTTVEAQMMSQQESFAYAAGDGYQAVQLPYVDGSLAMLVVVPDAEFASFAADFGAADLAAVVAGLAQREVALALPKFEFRTQASLKKALIALGMPIAFTDAADFSAMTEDGQSLAIQDVVHEAFISVDEDGTEAAAATAVIVGETSAPGDIVRLDVDRPFLFFVRDTETGATLFMGQVTNPAE